ncbi:DNA polymerase III subunit delta [Helicobacter vulpis]|uniref:DNA polymerase III subunit delta n=1 Tax=Helicobacter vulpis TaxID=2316076 RepID=UPI001F291C8B|nr:DNA polymerase III [Helicobacter vulpis]
MYHPEFLAYLERATPRVALFYGEYVFYIDHYGQKILDRYPQAQVQRFYFNDYDFKAILEALSQNSLFGEGVVVYLKLDQKLGAKECCSLLEVVASHPRNALVIGFYPGKNKAQYAQQGKQFGAQLRHPKLQEQIVEVRFFTPDKSELLALLQEKAHVLGLQIETQALHLLLELHHNDVGIIYPELEKWSLCGHLVRAQEIQQEVYGMGAVGVDALLDALFEKKQQCLRLLARLQAEGVDGVDLVRALSRYFYQLFLFASYFKMHGAIQPKQILGFNPPQTVVLQLSKRAGQVQNMRAIFELLRSWHVACMRGDTQAGWHFLIKVQDYID